MPDHSGNISRLVDLCDGCHSISSARAAVNAAAPAPVHVLCPKSEGPRTARYLPDGDIGNVFSVTVCVPLLKMELPVNLEVDEIVTIIIESSRPFYSIEWEEGYRWYQMSSAPTPTQGPGRKDVYTGFWSGTHFNMYSPSMDIR